MERSQYSYSSIIIAVIYLAGVIGHLIPATRQLFISLTPLTLLATGFFLLIKLLGENSDSKLRALIAWIITLSIFTFVLEAGGTETGVIFGDYSYGDGLGFKLLATPVVIPFNWLAVVLGSTYLSTQLLKNQKYVPIMAGILAVAFDVNLEILAPKLDYWSWGIGYAPTQNYLVWFLVVVGASWALQKLNISIPKIAGTLFIAHAIFIICLALLL